MSGITPLSSPPRYCSSDKYQLEEYRGEQPRPTYDPFTGIEIPGRQFIALQCPKYPAIGHDCWVLEGENWVKP